MQFDAITAYISDHDSDDAKQINKIGSGAKERGGRALSLNAARRQEIDVIEVRRLDR